jgi:hypothetical protein
LGDEQGNRDTLSKASAKWALVGKFLSELPRVTARQAVREGLMTTMPDDGERTMVNLVIGERGALTRRAARNAARAYQRSAARYPKAMMYVSIAGYDNDPRELWDIPEARDYFCRWAKFAGVDNSAAVAGSPLMKEATAALAKCGALNDVDPDEVHVSADLPDAPLVKH